MTQVVGKPPTFEEAKNRRQKARAAGLDPNYWYAVEHSKALKPGSVQQVRFWGQDPVALFRDEDGRLHAIEDRCAHRQLPLSEGVVKGSRIVCQYHGWEYNGAGELADVPHDLFGKKMPRCSLRAYPVKERYGLIFVFFGDAERAHEVEMPYIPQLEGDDPWACVPIDFTWNAHHSMIIDNVSDFTHEFLHRKYKPFSESKLTSCETIGDTVHLSYDTKVGRGAISKHFVDQKINTNAMKLAYQYPYQWSNTDEKIRDFCFVLPIDERTTRSFFLFYFDHFMVPFTPLTIPHKLMKPFLSVSNELMIKPLLQEDGRAVEAEQIGYERYWDEPLVELNPAVNAFQALTVRKWEEYLAREKQKKEQRELVRLERRRALEATGAD
jgi:phenylpropionate dioxygenase-like ring-hydroxylating dioxygenase large terminal subunit